MRGTSTVLALFMTGLTLVVGALPAAADEGEIRVVNGKVTLPSGGESPSVYFVLRNGGARPRTIVGASCECADRVSIRLTAISEDGQWSSEPMPDGMYVPAKGDVAFAPRGLFLRLLSPRPLATDEKVEIVLEFKDGEKVPFEAIVAAG
jgi:copper(I)-binding protein